MKEKTASEINKQKKKDSLKHDESFFRRIAAGGPGLSAIVDAGSFKIVFVNKQFERYFGYTNQHLAANDICFTDLLETARVQQFSDHISTIKSDENAWSHFVIYRVKNKSGAIGSYYLYASPACDEHEDTISDTPRFQLVLHPDLSKQDIPFTSFTTRELFLEHFIGEQSGTFEWVVGEDKTFWSESAGHIYELRNINEQSKNPFDFIHPNDRIRVEDETKKAIAGASQLVTDFKIITAKQNIKVIQCLAKIIKSQVGQPVILAGSLRDITKQRAVEEDLKNKVKELYDSNKDLEEFAYVASHDLQEPLRKITTFSDWLGEKYKDVLTGDGAMYLARMTAAAGNMRTLINDLLEFSRISRTAQSFEHTDLNKIMLQVITDLELVIEETSTVITVPVLPDIDAIPSQMKQLLSNIIANAIKFHRQGVTPAINIEVSVVPATELASYELLAGTTYYKLQITDNGIGFENEYAKRIFQVFQRLHGKSDYPGSGIGLTICKKIVDYHNGVIYAESIPGTGSRFVVIIPQYQKKN